MNLTNIENLKFLYDNRLKTLDLELTDLQNLKAQQSIHLEKLIKLNEFFQSYIQFKTEKTRAFLVNMVNRGLEYIFGPHIYVDITPTIKANKTVYVLNIVNKIDNIEGDSESFGGGVTAVIAFIFRFIISYLGGFYPLLILDESLTFVSYHYQEKLSQFIKDITREFDYSVLLISHQELLNSAADKIYETVKTGADTVLKDESPQQ